MMLRVLVAIVVLALGIVQAEAKRVALVIGNAKYATVGELFTPKRDVPLIEKALRESGFDDVDVRMDLGLNDLTTVLREFSDKASNAEVALVYFAGHGIEINKTNYLVPIDAKLRKAKDAGYEAIDLSMVRNAVSGASKLRMVVLDANPGIYEFRGGRGPVRSA